KQGISTGYQDGTFKPAAPVSRQAMAAFLFRMFGDEGFTAPVSSPFTDVATTHPFYREIAWMEAEGLSTGYSDGTYRPSVAVSRQAMAAFIYRALEEPAFTPPGTSPFADVGTSHPFYSQIAW